MNSRPIYAVLSCFALVCVMGLSESSAQRKPKKPQQAAPASLPTPLAPPTPTPPPPPDKILLEIKNTIDGFSAGEEAVPYERTFNFQFSKECLSGCENCTLTWDFERYGEKPDPSAARKVEKFSAVVKLSAINARRVFADETQVEFGTNNGRSITVKTGNPVTRTDYTDEWQISIRNEDAAERVARLLKQVLSESCPKP